MSDQDNNDGMIEVPQNTREAHPVRFPLGRIGLVDEHGLDNLNRLNGLNREYFEYIPHFSLPLTPTLYSSGKTIPVLDSLTTEPFNNMTRILQIESEKIRKNLVNTNRIMHKAGQNLSNDEYNRMLSPYGLIFVKFSSGNNGKLLVEVMPDIEPLARTVGKLERFTDRNFIVYALGENNARLVDNVPIVYKFFQDRATSLPISPFHMLFPLGIIFIDANSTFQGRYNPEYHHRKTDVGTVGLEIHELWHQVQYRKRQRVIPFLNLVIEQLRNQSSNNYDPYDKGDPALDSFDRNRIRCVKDIEALEGQAQFVGQWAADLYSLKTGYYKTDTAPKNYKEKLQLRKKYMAETILRSDIDSQGAHDILEEKL